MFEIQSHCPVCGGRLADRFLEEEERERAVCDQCGRVNYRNPIVVAGVIPVAGDRIWMLRRAIEPAYGYWTYPAGFMELGETVEQAAMRETREELNLDVRLEGLVGVYSFPNISTVHVIYRATCLGEPSAGMEALDITAFTVEQIPWDELAFRTTRAALQDWLRGNS